MKKVVMPSEILWKGGIWEGGSWGSTYIEKLGFFQCKSCLSVRPVSYWLELRVMGITQYQGYPSVSGLFEENKVPQCDG